MNGVSLSLKSTYDFVLSLQIQYVFSRCINININITMLKKIIYEWPCSQHSFIIIIITIMITFS
jgi:hypothetical protein